MAAQATFEQLGAGRSWSLESGGAVLQKSCRVPSTRPEKVTGSEKVVLGSILFFFFFLKEAEIWAVVGHQSEGRFLMEIVLGSSFNFFLFSFFGPHLWHMDVPRLGVRLVQQLPAYLTATAK